MSEEPGVLFHEAQSFLPFDPIWSWVLVGLCATIPVAIVLGLIIAWRRHGKGWPKKQTLPIVALLTAAFFFLLLPILVLLVLPTMTIEVRTTEVTAQLWPFMLEPDRIQMSTIREHYVRRYDPTGEFGGWGIRHGRNGARAYNVRGNMGVQLMFNDGRRLLLGSQQSESLNNAIHVARSQLSTNEVLSP